MNDTKAWWIGFFLIVFFILMSELIVVFREYVYSRLGLSRNLVLSLLWILPIISSFVVVSLSKKNRVLKGLSLIFILSFLGPLTHFITGQFGAVIDFSSLSGLKVTFSIYLVLSSLTIGFGTFVGMLVKKGDS